MKKTTIFLAAVLAMASVSCTKEEVRTVADCSNIKLNITVAAPGGDSKAAKTAWAIGDKINVWFESDFEASKTSEDITPTLVLTYNGSEWTGDFSAEPKAMSGSIRCLYEGNNDLTTFDISGSDWETPIWVLKPKSSTPLICTTSVAYYYIDGTFTAEIKGWYFSTRVQVVVSGHFEDSADKYSLSCDNLSPIECLKIEDERENLVHASYGVPVRGVSNSDGVAFCFTDVNSDITQDFTFTLKHYESDGTTVDWVKKYTTNNTLDVSPYEVQFISIADSKFVVDPYPAGKVLTIDGREGIVVDLGGTIGKIVIATKNEGADTDAAFGDYYTYNEAVAVENGTGWGGDWKMMTKEMFDALKILSNSHYEESGKLGRVWSIGSAMLFIPYAGYYYPGIGEPWSKTQEGAGFKVWSSSKVVDDPSIPAEYASYNYYYLEGSSTALNITPNGNPDYYRGSVRLCHPMPTE